MKKFLVIGCGGSGAATQAYMIDHLKAFLKTIDPTITKLPEAWQFLTIDVPLVPESGPAGLPNVAEAGGNYVSVGSSQNYPAFDQGLSQVLGRQQVLGEIATWASRSPEHRDTPISAGAGQYRGIGRILTIQNYQKIRDELEAALQRIKNSSRELEELNGMYSNDTGSMEDEKPLIFIVSSMAGGAGASMFLDVARLLTTLDDVQATETATFMYTPEVFEKLPADATVGQWPNALAMFGEAIAAQFGTGAEHDARLFKALGIAGSPQRTSIGRMIPVGARMGGQGAMFGDGTPQAVYRGLGRALAALMTSDQASNSFRSYTLANTGAIASDRSLHGWGDSHDPDADAIPWGSMGYAQLSMGRDRYEEYAAQRLARSAFDRLLRGHVDDGDPATGTEQLQTKLRERYPLMLRDVELPYLSGTPQEDKIEIQSWLRNMNYFNREAQGPMGRAEGELRRHIPGGDGMKSGEWKDLILHKLHDQKFASNVAKTFHDGAYVAVHKYADHLADSLLAQFEDQLARFGVPYLEELIQRFREMIRDQLVPALENHASALNGMHPLAPPPEMDAVLQPLNGRGTVNNSSHIVDSIVSAYSKQFREYFDAGMALLLARMLKDFDTSALVPLSRALKNTHDDLEQAEKVTKTETKFSDVASDYPKDWPRDEDERVDKRFFGSANEIVISQVEEFRSDYEKHIEETHQSANSDVRSKDEAIGLSVREVILGMWESEDAGKAPNDTLAPRKQEDAKDGNRMGWIDPNLTAPIEPGAERRESRAATFNIKVRPKDLVERARMWINRKNKPFSNFIDVDLRSYLTRDRAPNDAVYQQRVERLRAAFGRAVDNARPLAAVSEPMVHKASRGADRVTYRYSFSEIPFEAMDVQDQLRDLLIENRSLNDSTFSTFDEAQTQSRKVRTLEVFGAYPSYTPIVFSSLLPRIAKDWDARPGNKGSFWTLRRARPLPAALPLSNDERKAMVAGWLIGVTTGRIFVDQAGTDSAVAYIYDDGRKQWVNFPRVLLTPPQKMKATYDWMPAVIESVLLAYAHSHDAPPGGEITDSFRPYRLLRGLYDTGEQGPTTGDVRHPGVSRLAEWLRTGEQPPIGTGDRAPETLEARYEKAEKQFKNHLQLAQNFIPSTSGEFIPGANSADKPFADVTDRRQAKDMPLYRDLAPDVADKAADLLQKLDQAVQEARQPTAQQPKNSVPQMPSASDNTTPNIPGMPGGDLL